MQFDVPGWLASVMGCSRDDLVFDSERDADVALVVTYVRGGKPFATVSLAAMPFTGSRRAAWQVAAQIGDRLEQVQVPAETRFVWR